MQNDRLSEATLPEDFAFEMVEERLLSLDEIEPLEYQPSSIQRELDSTLYESIKHVGLQNPLVVAKAPNEKVFVPIAGGNSRLHALSCLYNETGDDSFAKVHCVVSEWPGTTKARLAHVITNQIRMRYSFASRAIAIVHIVDAERNSNPSMSMTQRDACQLLISNGYPISQSTFSYMEFLVNRLYPILSPELLEGIEIRDVRAIREIENRVSGQVGEQTDPSEDFNKLFNLALGEAASASVNSDELIRELKLRLGHGSSSSESSENLLPSSNDSFEELSEDPPQVADVQLDAADSNLVEPDCPAVADPEVKPDAECESDPIFIESKDSPPTEGEQKVVSEPTIRQLRQIAGNLAEEICNQYDMNKCFKKESVPCGFRVVAKPDGDESTIQYRLWCYLEAFAGDDQKGVSSPKVEDETGQKKKANESTQTRSLETGERFLDANVWFELDDRSWRNFVDLWDAVRTLKMNGRSGEADRIEEPNSLQLGSEEVADVSIAY